MPDCWMFHVVARQMGSGTLMLRRMRRPWISTNLAVSADGKISSVARCASGWTSAADHQRLQELRLGADALMVGRGTLVADRMTLAVPGADPPPLRCVVSSGAGRIAADHPVFHSSGGEVHILVTGNPCHELPSLAVIHQCGLEEFLSHLATDLGVKRVHCEGGGELIRSLAALGAIDEFHMTLAGHTLFGGVGAVTATGVPAGFLRNSLEFEISGFEPNGQGECFLSYRRKSQSALESP